MIFKHFEDLLPTKIALVALASIFVVSPVAFHIPDHLPEAWWGGNTLTLIQARLLFVLITAISLVMVALISVVNECRRQASEIYKLKRHMKAEELIGFSEKMRELNSKVSKKCASPTVNRS
ncbi:hypothetical protein [Lamprobacter modestohalophilus]|uniref:hypothetical protein n=1 Tax=Lamprobacter modestohalophilus TaxID=1064514 RepID=UPI001907BED4|nr:hypothetical protein [Lamprobacter modestohalophilus]